MAYLLSVSAIWALSFGLIKNNLTDVAPNLVAFIRMLLSFILFVPFLRISKIEKKFARQLVLTGMFQYGVMYMTYIAAFQFLPAYQVVLFTIFTPLYVTLFNDAVEKHFHPFSFIPALLAVLGTAIVVYRDIGSGSLHTGFLLLQVSNICFAAGQVLYKREMNRRKMTADKDIFALLYFGALPVTAAAAGISFFIKPGSLSPFEQIIALRPNQVWALLYLGILASGICFFLWNAGAKKVNIGTLAVLNNLKVPLGAAAALFIFGEEGDPLRLLAGGAVIAAALILDNRLVSSSRPGSRSQARSVCRFPLFSRSRKKP